MQPEVLTSSRISRPRKRGLSTDLACPACGTAKPVDFFSIDSLPVHIGSLYSTPSAALSAPMGRIDLTYCTGCALVQNRSYEAGRHHYEPGYEVQLVHSPLFATFLGDLADRLIARYNLRGKHIADIGCGPGNFLRLLCERGGNTGVGLDPTVPREGYFRAGEGSIELRRGFFTPDAFDGKLFDFVLSQSVLENIRCPGDFIRDMTTLVRPGGALYIEVSDGWRALTAGKTWVINYEMQNLFSLESLEGAAQAAGIVLTESGPCFTEQYVYVEGVPGGNECSPVHHPIPAKVTRMSREHAEMVDRWNRQLRAWRAENRRVMLWGSAGRSITFLNTVREATLVEATIDNNTGRQGLYLPGSGQPVISPAEFAADPPDVLLVSNAIYKGEIRRQVHEMGVDCEFHVI